MIINTTSKLILLRNSIKTFNRLKILSKNNKEINEVIDEIIDQFEDLDDDLSEGMALPEDWD